MNLTLKFAALLICLTSFVGCSSSDNGPWKDAGTLESIASVPVNWNEIDKSRVTTSQGYYLVVGRVVGKRSAQCYTDARHLWIEQDDGMYRAYALARPY